MLIDTHCHLTAERFADDLPEVVERARGAGVDAAITIGTGLEDARRCAELVDAHPDFLYRSAGLDPFSCHAAGEDFDRQFAGLAEHLRAGGCVALGEIGLEYYHDLLSAERQRTQLAAQLDLAVELELPVVIHCRDAHRDMVAVLREHPRSRGVIHSFAFGPDEARDYLDLGWYLSFNGMVTFKRNDALRAAAALVPADRLLVETDSPFLAPVPHRGKRSEPAFVADTAALVAEVRGERYEDLGAWTSRNARRLFALD